MDVYALSDPRTRQVRYVGLAKNAYRRYTQHLLDPHPNKDKDAWMEELKEAGTAPVLAILESGIDESAVREREKYWIHHYLSQGASLTNIHHVFTIQHENDAESEGTGLDLQDYAAACEAAEILSQKLGRPISPKYIRRLSKRKHNPVRTQPSSNRLLYSREDLEQVTITKKRDTTQ
jgi:hypothetical protein